MNIRRRLDIRYGERAFLARPPCSALLHQRQLLTAAGPYLKNLARERLIQFPSFRSWTMSSTLALTSDT